MSFTSSDLFSIAVDRLTSEDTWMLLEETTADAPLRHNLLSRGGLTKEQKDVISRSGVVRDMQSLCDREDFTEEDRLRMLETYAGNIEDTQDRVEFKAVLMQRKFSSATLMRLAQSPDPEIFPILLQEARYCGLTDDKAAYLEALKKIDFNTQDENEQFLMGSFLHFMPRGLEGRDFKEILTRFAAAVDRQNLVRDLLSIHFTKEELWKEAAAIAERNPAVKEEVKEAYILLCHAARKEPKYRETLEGKTWRKISSWIPEKLEDLPIPGTRVSVQFLKTATQEEIDEKIVGLEEDMNTNLGPSSAETSEIFEALSKNPNLNAKWHAKEGYRLALVSSSEFTYHENFAARWIAEPEMAEETMANLASGELSGDWGATETTAGLFAARILITLAKQLADYPTPEDEIFKKAWKIVQENCTEEIAAR